MPRPKIPAPPVKLPVFDYEGWARRLVQKVRDGQTVEDALITAEAYARDVRDIDCSREAARVVGTEARQIRANCDIPTAVINGCKEAARRDFGPEREFSDRKLARFLAGVFHEVHAAQVAEAAREARAQAEHAAARGDQEQASKWRRVAENLDAMGQSIVGGGFVPVPHPPPV